MSPELQAWKQSLPARPVGPANFEKNFFVRCAAVLLGDKEGELIALRPCAAMSLEAKLDAAEALCRAWGLDTCLLWRGPRLIDLMVYHATRLDASLRRVPTWVYTDLGLERPACGQAFLEGLRHNWQQRGTIPHAIGLALGYPLKDVLGFTGLAPLECSGQCGWRIYGAPGRSHARKQSFVSARKLAADFLA